MIRSLVFITSFLTLLVLQVGPAEAETASSPKDLLREADRCAKNLYGSKDKVKYRQNWTSCVESYRDVAGRYPKSDEAPWALFRAARMLSKLYGYSGREQDLDDAIELYRRVANDYMEHRLADDAQYRRVQPAAARARTRLLDRKRREDVQEQGHSDLCLHVP